MHKMHEFAKANFTMIRRFLKARLQNDYTTFRGHEIERECVRELVQRTAELGESNSLLLIGPRGSGKTTLINATLADLLSNNNEHFIKNTIIVCLNGYMHTDDKLALRSITAQMQLENAVDGKVFGSFAENLAFLLSSLKAGDKHHSKSVIFLLEEFDLFCSHHNQTLLYNLFDVAQSAQAPICVLGVTCRLDVIELLEKRVKSRFSHRQIFLFPNADDFSLYMKRFEELLLIPTEAERQQHSNRVECLKLLPSIKYKLHLNHYDPIKYNLQRADCIEWNQNIKHLMANESVRSSLADLYDLDVSQTRLKSLIFMLITQVDSSGYGNDYDSDCSKISCLTVEQLVKTISTNMMMDDKVKLLLDLSVLELCLIIAMKHHSEIYDRDPFNFEIIFNRFEKFTRCSTSMQGIEKNVALKAYERLYNLEFIMQAQATHNQKHSKQYEMHRMALTYNQINQAVQNYENLPTDVEQWCKSSLI